MELDGAGCAPAADAAAHPPRAPRRAICLYTPSADPSGMGMHMLDLAAEYASGADVSLLAWATPSGCRLLKAAQSVGVDPVPLPHPRAPAFAAAIADVLAERRPEVFHVHVGTGREDFDGARVARAAGVDLIVQTLHLPWLMGSRKHRVPLLHSLEPLDHIITVSDGQRRTYERAGVPAHRMTTIPNGVRPRASVIGREAARAALGLDQDRPVVMTVGRHVVVKGHRYLVEAARLVVQEIPDLAVVLIGDGHLWTELKQQVAAAGLQDVVQLVGARRDARMLLDAADVFVLPSLHEGMPLALLEAMEAGLPLVATRVSGSEEVVLPGETGLLVPPRRPAALAAGLAEVLREPRLRSRMGRAGRQLFLDRYTSTRMAEQTQALYGQLLAGAAPGSRSQVHEGLPGGQC